ncbi:unnamed protein product [Coccothraustes coccothraustes]
MVQYRLTYQSLCPPSTARIKHGLHTERSSPGPLRTPRSAELLYSNRPRDPHQGKCHYCNLMADCLGFIVNMLTVTRLKVRMEASGYRLASGKMLSISIFTMRNVAGVLYCVIM